MVKTVTLTAGTPQEVKFSESYPFYWIDNKTSGDVYASVGTPEPDKDGTYTIAAGSQLRISGGPFNSGLSLLGEGKVQILASTIADCPFKSAPVSGGGEIVNNESSYTLTNTADYPIIGLNMYGKSTQDGTPTPENPVEIVSVESPTVTVCGKNMYVGSQDWSGEWKNDAFFENVTETYIGLSVKRGKEYWMGLKKSLYVEKGKTYTFSCYAKADVDISCKIFILAPGEQINGTALPISYTESFNVGTEWTRYQLSYNCEKSGYIKPRIEKTAQDGNYLYVCGYQLEESKTMTDYAPYKGSTATITSAMPLCGIPVESGGNYTGSNGQQWVCDELVYNADGTGEIVKRTAKIDSYNGESIATPYISTTGDMTTGATVIYQLAEPQEIELTTTEISALRELQTFNGITNVYNDGGADMDVEYCTNKTLSEYVMPITVGLQKQIDELKAAVLSLGGNV